MSRCKADLLPNIPKNFICARCDANQSRSKSRKLGAVLITPNRGPPKNPTQLFKKSSLNTFAGTLTDPTHTLRCSNQSGAVRINGLDHFERVKKWPRLRGPCTPRSRPCGRQTRRIFSRPRGRRTLRIFLRSTRSSGPLRQRRHFGCVSRTQTTN